MIILASVTVNTIPIPIAIQSFDGTNAPNEQINASKEELSVFRHSVDFSKM